MGKKCCICSDKAEFCIKGTSDYYCKPCSHEQFGDITYLVKVEDDAQKLKRVIDDSEENPKEKADENNNDKNNDDENNDDNDDKNISIKIN